MLREMRPIAETKPRRSSTPPLPGAKAPHAPTKTAPTAAPENPQPKLPTQPSTSVGGRAVLGPGLVQCVRVAGRDVDVLLPAGSSFSSYVDGLLKSGVFADQKEALTRLASSSSSLAPGRSDARPTVGIVLSEPSMLLAGGHRNTENLIALVESMGCRPVLIPPCADLGVRGGPHARTRIVAAMAGSLDGLVGPGGADVDPRLYGEANTAALNTNLARDRFEADFIRRALDCDLFAFGICRSHQLWNAAAGGSLIQDVQSEEVVSVSHKEGHHPVEFTRKSMIYEEVRQRALLVNSLHHQAVDFAGWGFRVVGRVTDEHTGRSMIEATERWNGITTQFHPELMQDESAHRALLGTLGRRAHAFAALKQMGAPTLRSFVAHLRADPRFQKSDVDWAQRELGRRLPP